MNRIVIAAALAALAPAAWGAPGHYVVFELDADGQPQPQFYAAVELQADYTLPDAALRPSAPPADPHHVGLRTVTGRARSGWQELPLIRHIRGEFSMDPVHGDHRIDAVSALLARPAFVVRLPAFGQDGFELAVGGRTRFFDLGELQSRAADLPLADQVAALSVHRTRAGSPANRVDILVLGDGYTSAEQQTFDAQVASLRSTFFGVSPYLEYESFVNWTTGFVASSQSGADHPPYQAGCATQSCCADVAAQTDPRANTFVNTAFDARFCTSQIHRLLTVSNSKVLAAAAAYPDWDQILVSVNDPVYGGAGGSFSVTSAATAARLVLIHEYGHTFHRLADEYTTPFPGFPACSDLVSLNCEANVTNQTNASLVKWRHWFTPGLPIPTPAGTAGLGLFEGARYLTAGMYRPTHNQCLMRALGTSFCAVCRQEYVRRLYRGGWGTPAGGVDLIEPGTVMPTASSVAYTPGVALTFSATLLVPTIDTLTVQWLLDGTPVPGADAPSFQWTPAGGDTATHSLELRVTDSTAFVHPAMADGLTTHARSWTLQPTGSLFANGFE